MKKRSILWWTMAGVLMAASVQASVFINEIHYDNAGSDVNEGIELAITSPTSLDGWDLVLYNGATGLTYGSLDLTGSYSANYTVFFPIPSIQNGDPDGIALVDDADNIVQFLSYGGNFIATGGPASGMWSTDILVSEDGAATGCSLQLGGIGNEYAHFTWQSQMTSTFDLINTNQTFGAPVPIPSAVWLFGSGLIGIVGIRRKFKK